MSQNVPPPRAAGSQPVKQPDTTSRPAQQTASNLPTPFLSPSISTEPSPAFSLQTPAGSEVDEQELLDLGPPVDQDPAVWHIPECWGHRGASADFPENTHASFVAACKEGADGIETDLHITSDNVLVCFHDPELARTTDGTGRIDTQPWHGVLEHVRTKKEPQQPIPQFKEVLDILMEPANRHVKLNLDCKIENEPVKLFNMIKDLIQDYKDWTTRLAPRIILGIWHPKYIIPAAEILPYLPRYAISMSIPEARKYFFDHCHGFSVKFECLASADGVKFRSEAKAAGKWICAWTVNDREDMKECARWGIRAVISDKPALWRVVKAEIVTDKQKALKADMNSLLRPYLSTKNYWFEYERQGREETEFLEREGGRFDSVDIPAGMIRVGQSVQPAWK